MAPSNSKECVTYDEWLHIQKHPQKENCTRKKQTNINKIQNTQEHTQIQFIFLHFSIACVQESKRVRPFSSARLLALQVPPRARPLHRPFWPSTF